MPTNGIHVSSTYNPGSSTYRIEHTALSGGAAATLEVTCNGSMLSGTTTSHDIDAGTEVVCSFSYTGGDVASFGGQARHYAGDDPNNVTGFRHALTQWSLDNGPFDRTDPVPTLNWSSDLMTGAQTVTLMFSEDVQGFDLTALTLENLTGSALAGSGNSYSFTVTPIADGPVSVRMASNAVLDLNGNGNDPSNILSGRADLLAPTLEISGVPASITDTTPFTATFTFSEDVTGFVLGDIVVAGGSVALLTGGPAVYAAEITPDGLGDVSVVVGAGAAQDEAGRDSEAAQANALLDTATIGAEANARFMLNRANQLLANQPELSQLLRGAAGHFNADVTNGRATIDFFSGGSGPLWADLSASWSRSGSAEDTYVLGTFGLHQRFGDNLLAGVMLEVDYMEEIDGIASLSGTGWLAGPYVVARLPEHPVYLDARLLYGRSFNQASPLGSYTDDFTTTRWLAMVNFSGDIALDTARLSPHLSAAWTQDTQAEYVDGASNTVASQVVSLTQITAGAEYVIPLGALELSLGADAIWSSTQSGLPAAPGFEGGRGRLSLGLSHHMSSGGHFRLGISYDGFGQPDYESLGADLALSIPF